jgi:hypothetical protein
LCAEYSTRLYKKINGKWTFIKSYFSMVSWQNCLQQGFGVMSADWNAIVNFGTCGNCGSKLDGTQPICIL